MKKLLFLFTVLLAVTMKSQTTNIYALSNSPGFTTGQIDVAMDVYGPFPVVFLEDTSAITVFPLRSVFSSDNTNSRLVGIDPAGKLEPYTISALPFKSSSYTPTSGEITTALGYTPYNSTNPNGYITTNNVYTNGFGISKTGTEPNVTFSVNTSDIMTVNRAADSITALNTNINGKVPQSRTLQFVAGSGISISPTGAQNLSANRTFTITATGSNPGATTFEGIGTGTTYNLTTTSAKVDFGTTDPSITLTSPGTYMIVTNVKLDYAGLTTLGASTSTLKVRRTNNTATDLATTGFTTPILTLLTATAGDCDIRTFIYTTSNSNDVLEVWGNRGANVTVGNVVVSEASIIAIKIN